MNMPKSRDIRAKIPLPQQSGMNFGYVTVNGVNSNVTLILFALHYIQQNARSTVQTEQAMPEMLEGVGPGRAKRQQI